MSVAGIASSLFSYLTSAQNTQRPQIQTEFQQLGQDLSAGNLTQAQTDFAALQQNVPAAQSNGASALSQAFSALGKDLQSGNITGAQQDFANIQQDVAAAQQNGGGQVHHHHHHHGGGSSSSSAQSQNSITQLFSTLGQDLQTGNLTSAQQAYSALQQDLPQLAGNFGSGGADLPTSALSLTA